jgi:hypothetical protein
MPIISVPKTNRGLAQAKAVRAQNLARKGGKPKTKMKGKKKKY